MPITTSPDPANGAVKTRPRAFPGSRVESVLNYRRSAALTGRLTGGPASPGRRQRVVAGHGAARSTPLYLSNQAGVVTRHPIPDSSSVQGYYPLTEYHLTTRQDVPKASNHPPNRGNSSGRSASMNSQSDTSGWEMEDSPHGSDITARVPVGNNTVTVEGRCSFVYKLLRNPKDTRDVMPTLFLEVRGRRKDSGRFEVFVVPLDELSGLTMRPTS